MFRVENGNCNVKPAARPKRQPHPQWRSEAPRSRSKVHPRNQLQRSLVQPVDLPLQLSVFDHDGRCLAWRWFFASVRWVVSAERVGRCSRARAPHRSDGPGCYQRINPFLVRQGFILAGVKLARLTLLRMPAFSSRRRCRPPPCAPSVRNGGEGVSDPCFHPFSRAVPHGGADAVWSRAASPS